MERLCESLGRPERRYRVAHVAGTKGKGSTSALLASILRAQGLRVGLYTSPHLAHLGERIAVDGRPASETDLGAAWDVVEPAVRALLEGGERVTFFEVTTALAFVRFAAAGCDAAVVEVGLGGRLDSTNVVRPEATAITSIGLDHQDKLGLTLEKIAFEKAGIVKNGVPLVSGVPEGAAAREIARICEERGAPLLRRGRHFEARPPLGEERILVSEAGTVFGLRTPRRGYDRLSTRLAGRHMAENAALAATAAELMGASEEATREGLARGWIAGRFQLVRREGRPRVVVDGAHNPDAALRLLEAFRDVYGEGARATLVLGAMRDKDVAGIVALLAPIAASAVAAPCGSPRETPAAEVAALLAARGVPSPEVASSAEDAIARADALAGPDGLVLVTGSLYLAGAALAALGAPIAGPSPG
jgi:dihydrofolate synthase/folylpolyglutamate synthase